MLYRTFHSNSNRSLIMNFMVMLLLWGRVFFYKGAQPLSLDGISMPLWSSLIIPLFGQSAFWAAAFSFLVAFSIGFTLTRSTWRYGLLQQQSMLPLAIYAFMISGFLTVQRLNPVWLFTLFFLPAIDRLMGAAGSKRPYIRCFDAAFFLAIGSLFYARGLFLFPLIWVFMGLLRLFTPRSFIATILGLILPYALSLGYFYYTDRTPEFINLVAKNMFFNAGQFSYSTISQIYAAILLVFALISIVNVVRFIPFQKIVTRKQLRVVIWTILLTASAGLTPFFSIEIIPLFSLGLAIAIAFWIEKIKRKRLKEIILWSLLVVTIGAQVLI